MTENKDKKIEGQKKERKPLTLQLSSGSAASDKSKPMIRQNLAHGRSKTVSVEVKKSRIKSASSSSTLGQEPSDLSGKLTGQEQNLRIKALKEAFQKSLEKSKQKQELLENESEQKITEEAVEVTQTEESNPIAHTEEEVLPFAQVPEAVLPPAKESFSKPKTVLHKRPSKIEKLADEDLEETAKKKAFKAASKKKTLPQTQRASLDLQNEEDTHKGPVLGLKKLRKGKPLKAHFQKTVKKITVFEQMSVKDLAMALCEKAPVLVRKLSKMGLQASEDQNLDLTTLQLLVEDFGHQFEILQAKNPVQEILDEIDSFEKNKVRPPVVTVMGHVDHGKTSLLDAFRQTHVVAKEAGGITQHIGAYQTTLSSGQKVTFIDTPGHEAFSKIRARGANVTDIVILVVAADDHVNAQTIEAIAHARTANVPIIVAINKIDKQNAKPDQIRQELLAQEIVVESLGGDVLDVEISALTKKNLNKLEEAILLQAEILELKASDKCPPCGIVIDTHIKKGIGSVATVLVQNGILRKGQCFAAGEAYGRVRLMFDDKGKPVSQAPASMPIEVSGFQNIPNAGDLFIATHNEAESKEICDFNLQQKSLSETEVSRGSIFDQLKTAQLKELTLILKADVQGSLEGLAHELKKIQHDEVTTNIIHQAIGPVNESDILLAKASKATILAFNNEILPQAKKLAETEKVTILKHNIIYHAIDEIKQALSGFLTPDYKEIELGQAEVLKVFSTPKGQIAGSVVKKGLFRRGERVRIIRNGKQIYEDQIKSLRHLKDEHKEIKQGYEFGLMLDQKYDFEPGDVLVCFHIEETARSV